jgi:hypothetical protein
LSLEEEEREFAFSQVLCVLVPKIVEAQYAFVLHTVNPTTSDPSEIFGEWSWCRARP